ADPDVVGEADRASADAGARVDPAVDVDAVEVGVEEDGRAEDAVGADFDAARGHEAGAVEPGVGANPDQAVAVVGDEDIGLGVGPGVHVGLEDDPAGTAKLEAPIADEARPEGHALPADEAVPEHAVEGYQPHGRAQRDGAPAARRLPGRARRPAL